MNRKSNFLKIGNLVFILILATIVSTGLIPNANAATPTVYFECDFTKTYASPYSLSTAWPSTEPVGYKCEKGVWNWITLIQGGTMKLIPDPSNPSQSCLQMTLAASGTRPVAGDQQAKLYELQNRQASNYNYPSVMVNKECWYNFNIWIPSDFKVNGWRLVWQIMRDAGAPSNFPGPHMELVFGTSGLYFDIKPLYVDGTNYHQHLVMSTASFPKGQWVPVSIYVKQGTRYRSMDGTVIIYVNGQKVLEQYDMQTGGYSGNPLVTWGIANYGSPMEAQGQYILFKNVNVANQRFTSTTPSTSVSTTPSTSLSGALVVTSPNGGGTWVRRTSQTINWTSTGSSGAYVKIELLKGGVLNTVISASTPNDGSFSWYIPYTQTLGADYRIRITSTTNTAITDSSNANFNIIYG